MRSPKKNRLHGYEVGWFTLLLRSGVASESDLRAAQARVAQAAIERMARQRRSRRMQRRRRRRDD